MAQHKKLDPYAEEYKKATLEDLVMDAVARKDKKALEWLDTESAKKEERNRKKGTITVKRSISKIRAEYAKQFLNYKPNAPKSSEQARKRKQEKAEQARIDLFKKAFEELGE